MTSFLNLVFLSDPGELREAAAGEGGARCAQQPDGATAPVAAGQPG